MLLPSVKTRQFRLKRKEERHEQSDWVIHNDTGYFGSLRQGFNDKRYKVIFQMICYYKGLWADLDESKENKYLYILLIYIVCDRFSASILV